MGAGRGCNLLTREDLPEWQVFEQVLQSTSCEKDYVKAVYCHPAYLIYMQNAS